MVTCLPTHFNIFLGLENYQHNAFDGKESAIWDDFTYKLVVYGKKGCNRRQAYHTVNCFISEVSSPANTFSSLALFANSSLEPIIAFDSILTSAISPATSPATAEL